MSIRFDGRVALVTGAGAGLGRCYALGLARRGAKVIVNDLIVGTDGTTGPSEAALETVDEICDAGGAAIADGSDVSNVSQVTTMVGRAVEEWGRLDVLVSNAGNLRDKSFAKMELADFRAVLEVHLMGAVHCAKAAWEVMRQQNYGRIAFISSSAGIYGNFGQANYSAAKMSLVGLMNTLHLEGQKYDIRVNTLTPEAATPAALRISAGQLSAERFALLPPEAVTPALLYLVSEDGPFRTILSAGAGAYARILIHETSGIWLPEADRTPEMIAQRFDDISAEAGQIALREAYDQANKHVAKAAEALGIAVPD
jgi:NAD(P)-dependent dehydrogenase (short-subunit alcohol dehydrogenase family)